MKRSNTICLSMIVKNEAQVIQRCLESVRPLIDHWVIVDTGSSDGTQEIVREFLRDIPGELYERQWVDFAHNRTEALRLAKGRAEYIFVIDADEVIECEPGFFVPPLTHDSYNIQVDYAACLYLRRQLVRDALEWRYQGVVHEYLTCPAAQTEQLLPGIRTVPRHDGARACDPLTYRRDALVLEKALLEDPKNARYVFYLAQSYRDAGELDLALKNYQRRVDLGGWPEEVWYSLYQIAQIKERQSADTPSLWPSALEAYLKAHQYKPDRAGPLYRLGMHYQGRSEYRVSHLFLAEAIRIAEPASSSLFIEHALYDYQIALEYAVSCYYVGDHACAIATNNALLRGGKVPAHVIHQVIRNRRFSLDAIHPKDKAWQKPSPAVRVLVPFRNPGAALDDCIDGLSGQDCPGLEVLFVDDASATSQRDRFPSERPAFSYVRHEVPLGFDACVQRYGSDAPGLVVVLRHDSVLVSASSLLRLLDEFADPGCRLAYGQHRMSSGKLGMAEPASTAEAFVQQGPRLADASAVAARSSLIAAAGIAGPQGIPGLFREAGFAHTRFVDEVITRVVPEPSAPRQNRNAPAIASNGFPLVSCLMVTLDRLSLARNAIRSYADQTYPNRELVIVTDGKLTFQRALERFVEENQIPGVRFLHPDGGTLPLGRLRNISLDAARGEIVCQWDDDDASHPERLMLQVEHMFRHNARACFLTDHLQFIEDQHVLCWVDWTVEGRAQGMARLAPGTGVMYRDPRFRYPETGPLARQGEDSVLLNRLYNSVPVAALSNAGHLYLYRYHGRNTFSREHHFRLSNFRTSKAWLTQNEAKIRNILSYYNLARPLFVVGKEGAAFAVN